MSEVKEETNTCSYEERSRCGCENLSWRYLNDKWVDDYRALVSKIHLLTPTAFLSRCDWDCLRKDWDILRCLRQVMFDPFRRDFLPNCIRLWRRLVVARRQNMPKWQRIQRNCHVLWYRSKLHCHWFRLIVLKKQWAEIRCVSSTSFICDLLMIWSTERWTPSSSRRWSDRPHREGWHG